MRSIALGILLTFCAGGVVHAKELSRLKKVVYGAQIKDRQELLVRTLTNDPAVREGVQLTRGLVVVAHTSDHGAGTTQHQLIVDPHGLRIDVNDLATKTRSKSIRVPNGQLQHMLLKDPSMHGVAEAFAKMSTADLLLVLDSVTEHNLN
jgi:hypothetical protein